ncbi:MAG: NAD-dependent epimerase/dehydratase family protein, partial [Bacteroidota bacterium]
MKKILLLGENSFAGKGLNHLLKEKGFEVHCLSRGEESRDGNKIRGNVFEMVHNKFLDTQYDLIINFILIKNGGLEENIRYIKSLDELCTGKKVSNLVFISSMSCYSADAEFIDEKSEIEKDYKKKGSYGSIKVAVDHYIKSLKDRSYKVSFVRPGFIYDKNDMPSITGVGIRLSSFLAIVLGNRKTPLTIIKRNRFHEAIIRIIETGCKQDVYLIFENNQSTKKEFLRRIVGFRFTISLNKTFIMVLAKMARIIGVLNDSKSEQVNSLFRTTEYNCFATEYNLSYSFIENSYCVIGIGTYGSYIAKLIHENIPNAFITIFDVGNGKVKSEDEIGYKSKVLKDEYNGTTKGRFFGFGGTSNKWGGQLLTFSENDFKDTHGFLRDIVDLNLKFRDKVFERFGIKNNFFEKRIDENLFIKTGYWLGYFKRNLFKALKVYGLPNKIIKPRTRIVKIFFSNKSCSGFKYKQGQEINFARFDHYFLSTGAFESFRILLNSGKIKDNHVPFSDHLSKKAFLVKGSTKIGKDDFAFRVEGSSLITKRIIGETTDRVSFYFNPNYNDHFPFFQNLKKLLFKKEISIRLIWSI